MRLSDESEAEIAIDGNSNNVDLAKPNSAVATHLFGRSGGSQLRTSIVFRAIGSLFLLFVLLFSRQSSLAFRLLRDGPENGACDFFSHAQSHKLSPIGLVSYLDG